MKEMITSPERLRRFDSVCRASLVLILVFMLAPTEIPAQEATGFKPLEFNVHVSMLFLGDSRIADRADPATGARLVYRLPGGIGFGGNFDWTRQGIDVRLEDPMTPLFLVNDVLFYSGEIGYTFRSGRRIQYFMGTGLGGATIRQAQKDLGNEVRNQTFVLVPIGGGLRILDSPSDPTFAVRMDLRDHVVWIGESENREVFLRNEGAIHNVELSAGISFLLEGY